MILEIKNLHLGGILDGHYQTNYNSLMFMSGMDPFSERGVLQNSRAMAKEQTTTNGVNAMVACSDGNVYMFTSGGEVIQRTPSPVYTTVYSGGGGGWGSAAILNAFEHIGYLYIATGANLYRWQIGAAWAFGVGVTLVGAFTAADALYKPMIQKFDTLYIGDGRYVAQVGSTGTFTANAFDLTSTWRITCLGETSREIVIGTTTPTNTTSRSRVFMWNTYSTLCSESYLVNDGACNAIFSVNGSIVVSAGYQGSFYQLSNYQLQRIKQLPLRNLQSSGWEYDTSAQCTILPNSVFYKDGMAYFGISSVGGSPNVTWQGVYAFGSKFAGDPPILSFPYQPSTSTLSIDIKACCTTNTGQVLIAWTDRAGSAGSGVDTYYTGVARDSGFRLQTGFIVLDRRYHTNVKVTVAYRTLPTGWSVSGSVIAIDETIYDLNFINDDLRRLLVAEVHVSNIDTFSISIGLASGSLSATAFAIESIIIETDI